MCTKDRKNMFGEVKDDKMMLNRYGYITKRYIKQMITHFRFIKIYSFIIMPNHVHLIVFIKYKQRRDSLAIRIAPVEMIHESSLRESPKNNYKIERRKMLLSKIVGRFKMQSSKKINLVNRATYFHWQQGFYDHIIRTEFDLWKSRKYIIDNPVNWKKDRNYRY